MVLRSGRSSRVTREKIRKVRSSWEGEKKKGEISLQLNSAELLKTGEVGRAGGSRCSRCGQGIGGGGNF